MKKAFSLLELLIIVIILCLFCFFISKGKNPVNNYVNERKELNTKQEVINKQLDDIQKAKQMRNQELKQNFGQNY